MDVDDKLLDQWATRIHNSTDAANTIEGEAHRGLGMILAGIAVLSAIGTHRKFVDQFIYKTVTSLWGVIH